MLQRLYLVVTPRPSCSREELLDRTERALGGGVELLQLRAKDWEARPTLELGERMLALARRHGVPFFLNDRPDLAALLGADGVHLGQEDLTPGEARRFFAGVVGRSTHRPEQALRALEEGVNYLSIGPIWETPTKPGRPAAGLAYVRWAAENLGERPWFAIGGIDLGNLAQVLEAGARRIVVVRAILDAPNPEQAAKSFREALDGLA